MSDNGFYRAFEDRYRGSRELIQGRLKIYKPFVEPLLTVYSEAAVVDLGCGRGEWLELMADLGLQTVGIDLDEGMLSACMERRLNVVKQEATAFLKSLPDESQCVVSGFHIVEHIPFSDLQLVVVEALRVLKPGGLLILETPNPENVVVGSSSFYLDPTHQRPIPPRLLEFLPEYYGFERVKILRLQEAPELTRKEGVELIDVFLGVSPDYSIVAQKAAGADILAEFDEPFFRSYGIELGQLASRFDVKLDRRCDAVEKRVSELERVAEYAERVFGNFVPLHERLLAEVVRAERSEAKATIAGEQLLAANTRLDAIERELAGARDLTAQLESRAVFAEAVVGEMGARLMEAEAQRLRDTTTIEDLNTERTELQRAMAAVQGSEHYWRLESEHWHERILNLHRSNSWRITAPLRAMKRLLTGDLSPIWRATEWVGVGIRSALRRPVIAVARVALNQPTLRKKIGTSLRNYPNLRQHLVMFVHNAGLVPEGSPVSVNLLQKAELKSNYIDPTVIQAKFDPEFDVMTSGAKRIYADLKTAIEQNVRNS